MSDQVGEMDDGNTIVSTSNDGLIESSVVVELSTQGEQLNKEETNRFEICTGPFTKEEKEHLLNIGHIYEKDGQIFDVSTLNESDFGDELNDSVSVKETEIVEKGPETPEVIEISEAPELIERSKTPEAVENSEASKIMESFETSEMIESSETPEVIEISEGPELIERSKTPEAVENSEASKIMESFETSEMIESSETPEVIEISEAPELIERSKTPEAVENSEASKIMESFETSEMIESSETPEVIEISEAPELFERSNTPEAVENSEASKVMESFEMIESSETPEVIETSEASEVNESVETTEIASSETPVVIENLDKAREHEIVESSDKQTELDESLDAFSISASSAKGLGFQNLFPKTPATPASCTKVLRRSQRVAQRASMAVDANSSFCPATPCTPLSSTKGLRSKLLQAPTTGMDLNSSMGLKITTPKSSAKTGRASEKICQTPLKINSSFCPATPASSVKMIRDEQISRTPSKISNSNSSLCSVTPATPESSAKGVRKSERIAQTPVKLNTSSSTPAVSVKLVRDEQIYGTPLKLRNSSYCPATPSTPENSAKGVRKSERNAQIHEKSMDFNTLSNDTPKSSVKVLQRSQRISKTPFMDLNASNMSEMGFPLLFKEQKFHSNPCTPQARAAVRMREYLNSPAMASKLVNTNSACAGTAFNISAVSETGIGSLFDETQKQKPTCITPCNPETPTSGDTPQNIVNAKTPIKTTVVDDPKDSIVFSPGMFDVSSVSSKQKNEFPKCNSPEKEERENFSRNETGISTTNSSQLFDDKNITLNTTRSSPIKDTNKSPSENSQETPAVENPQIFSSTPAFKLINLTPSVKTPKLRRSSRIARNSINFDPNTSRNLLDSFLENERDIDKIELVGSYKAPLSTLATTCFTGTTDSPCLINLDASLSKSSITDINQVEEEKTVSSEKDIDNSCKSVDRESVKSNMVEAEHGRLNNSETENDENDDFQASFKGNHSGNASVATDASFVITGSRLHLESNKSELEDISNTSSLMRSVNLTAYSDSGEENDNVEAHEDTIELMEKLLAKADVLEDQDVSTVGDMPNRSATKNNTPKKIRSSRPGTPASEVLPFNKRLMDLKKRGALFSPSPPRPPSSLSLARDLVLQQQNKQNGLHGSPTFKTPTPKPLKLASNLNDRRSIGLGSPVPRSLLKVQAKVDSGLGLRNLVSPGASLGLNSPVANYIHSKPAPSPFQRITGKPKAIMSAGKPIAQSSNKLSSLIPRPSLPSGTLKNASMFNSQTNSPSVSQDKFKQHQYTGSKNVRMLNDSSVGKHGKENYLAQRHTGVRDENADASIVQNAIIPKKFIQSRKEN